ncbi:hypothetical protein HMPREF0484_2319 [Klebsiella pneumoniae subsp. rhinoscleromatis ATCC 13884]|nr:hypothetical protein HMPREF0484_2319 [Klebsiella pneumoniae subsp. rhinoscleromatis ATCC 13884]
MLVFSGHFHPFNALPPEFFAFPDDFAAMIAMKHTGAMSYPHKPANR